MRLKGTLFSSPDTSERLREFFVARLEAAYPFLHKPGGGVHSRPLKFPGYRRKFPCVVPVVVQHIVKERDSFCVYPAASAASRAGAPMVMRVLMLVRVLMSMLMFMSMFMFMTMPVSMFVIMPVVVMIVSVFMMIVFVSVRHVALLQIICKDLPESRAGVMRPGKTSGQFPYHSKTRGYAPAAFSPQKKNPAP
jgi:hypothetical protein